MHINVLPFPFLHLALNSFHFYTVDAETRAKKNPNEKCETKEIKTDEVLKLLENNKNEAEKRINTFIDRAKAASEATQKKISEMLEIRYKADTEAISCILKKVQDVHQRNSQMILMKNPFACFTNTSLTMVWKTTVSLCLML